MSNSTLSTKLASFINGQMTGFLTQVAEKHSIDSAALLAEWEAYTGLKPKTKKTVVKGPTIKELREKLKGVNLPISGKKQDLIDRLADFEAGKIKPKVLDTASAIAAGDYSVMNVKMLKEKLKEKGLKLSGKKSELVKRLTDSDNDSEDSESDNEGDEEGPNYKTYTVKKLRAELKARGLKVKPGDKKEDLIKYLEDDDKHMDDSESESESESEDSDCETSDDEEDTSPTTRLRKTLGVNIE